MVRTMTDHSHQQTWLSAIVEAARRQQLEFPSFDGYGMGTMRSATTASGRFVTLKRRIRRAGRADVDGVEWALWNKPEDLPVLVAAFRDRLEPEDNSVAATLSLLKGWLLDQWTPDQAKVAVSKHPGAQPVKEPPSRSTERQEYWFSEDRGFGIVVEKYRWSLHSRGKCLSSWRVKGNGTGGEYLELTSLDRLCTWVAKQWVVLAYGGDYRPKAIRGYPVAASRAYEIAELAHATENDSEVPAWWSRHAVRAADSELPNLYFERQADDIVISWDASPTPTRFYQIPTDEEIARVAVAIPVLRALVKDRLNLSHLGSNERQVFAELLASDSSAGYAAVKHYSSTIDDGWLASHGFSESDAQEFAELGTSRHPVVGLLRSSQGSSLTPDDYDVILRLLKPSDTHSFTRLRELAKGMSGGIDPREPWESGYRLARLVRVRLGYTPSDQIDIEQVASRLGIDIQEASLKDTSILGVCIGTPGYSPLVTLNSNCPDSSGVSGRRVTLAHELCHLLFDRAGLRSLARFEGGGADSDRLIEMRANAFAVELLVPMATLVGDAGLVVDDIRLAEIAEERKVSSHALQRHANNLRNRLS